MVKQDVWNSKTTLFLGRMEYMDHSKIDRYLIGQSLLMSMLAITHSLRIGFRNRFG
jgi:hypothetical protein